MTEPVLVVIRGNSGSGKSTLANALQAHFGLGSDVLKIPQDLIRRDMLHTRDRAGTLQSPLLRDLIAFGHANCRVTILEGILPSCVHHELFEYCAALYGSRLHAYYYDLPFEETVRRTKEKQADWGEDTLRKWWQGRDLDPVLHETLIPMDTALDQALWVVLADLQA